jgi:predicted DNA-binding protein (UPF0251 family)
MPRPRHCRRVGQLPLVNFYKPRGIPLKTLELVQLTVDELESIRLADLEGMYQAQAAEKMNVSRQTLGRILESAHKKIADTLVNGKALSIEGGQIKLGTTEETIQSEFPGRLQQGCGRGRRRRHRGGTQGKGPQH